MAELNGDGVPQEAVAVPTPAEDAHAVRARLAATSRLGDEPPLRIAGAAAPLRMTNPTVGVGPLGGVASGADRDVEVGVLAQRQLLVDGTPTEVILTPAGHDRHLLVEEGRRTRVILGPDRRGDAGTRVREVLVDGFRFEVEVEPERLAALRERARRGHEAGARTGPLDVRAIIPGKVVSVSVAPGDTVTAGQQLLVVEAMKMQNELRAPRDGTIDKVGVAPGVNIEVGDLLVVIS